MGVTVETAAQKQTPRTVRGTDPPWVGRARESAILARAVRETVDGRGGLVLVSGEPGIGKTRLIETAACGDEALVVWGRCWESGGAPPLWPWFQVLRSLTEHVPRSLDQSDGADPAHVLLGPGTNHEVAPHERFARFEQTAELLHVVAEERPLIVVLDDLHAADEPSLLLTRFVAQRTGANRVLLIGAFRDTAGEASVPVAGLLASLATEGRQIRLSGLTEAELNELAAQLSDDPVDVGLLHDATGGNPFFAQELLYLGQVEDLDAVPLGVRGAVRWRLDRLPGATLDLLTVASVLGREFAAAQLELLAGLEPTQLMQALEPALAADLVAPRGLGRYGFSHGLVRETLYEDLGAGARCELHGRAVGVLEAMQRAGTATHLTEVAHHAVAALPVGDPRRAVDLTRAAARQAWVALAFEEAARLWRLGQDLAEVAGLSGTERLELGRLEADALAAAGRVGAARGRYVAVVAEARDHGDVEAQALAVLGFGTLLWDVWLQDERVELQRAALAALGENGDPILRARLLAHLAAALALRGDRSGEDDELARTALELAGTCGDARAKVEALSARRWSLRWTAEDVRARLAVDDEMVVAAEELGDRDAVLRALWGRSNDRLLVLDRAGAAQDARRFALEAESARYPLHRWAAGVRVAMEALLDGRFGDAHPLALEAAAFGEQAGLPLPSAVLGVQLFLLYAERDDLAELEEQLRALPASFLAAPVTRCSLVWLSAARGRFADARASLAALSVDRFAAIAFDGGSATCALAFLADTALALGDRSAATVLYELLEPQRGLLVHAPGWAVYGTVDLYLGSLRLAMDDEDGAVALLRDAVEQCRRIGAPAWEAHAHHRLATALRAAGRHEAARAHETSARAIASRLDMVRLQRLLDEGSSPAADPPVPAPAPPSQRCVELAREGEYWTVHGTTGTFRLRDAKGLRYLAMLLDRPDTEVHVVELVAAARGQPASRRPSQHEDGLVASRASGVGPALDDQAKRAYRRRLEDLREEVEEATRFNDDERRARAEEEIAFLANELAGAVGLGGRDRPVASPVEQSRVNVTKAIRSAIRRIETHDGELGTYLTATVRTGTYCAYAPSAAPAGRWTVTTGR